LRVTYDVEHYYVRVQSLPACCINSSSYPGKTVDDQLRRENTAFVKYSARKRSLEICEEVINIRGYVAKQGIEDSYVGNWNID
jgi:hypothetical protein